MLVLAGGTAAFGALSKTVTLTVDGQRTTIRTFGDTVSDVLAAKDITIRAGDKLSPSPFGPLSDGDHIDLSYAHPVTLAVDGKVSQHTVYQPTVGKALSTLGVKPASGAYMSVKRSSTLPRTPSKIVVSSAKSLTVMADGKKSTVDTTAPTVGAVLKAADVTIGKNDEVEPAVNAYVAPDTELKVVRINKVTKTESVSLKYPVTVRQDASALKGVTKVLTPGKKGETREKVTLVMADGKVRDRIILTSDVISEPVAQVESHGTKTVSSDASSNTVWDKIAKCESGGNWSTNTGNGYYGGLQFSAATWHGVGGSGLPSDNSREEQIKRAKILQARSGWGQWGCAGARFN